MSQGSGQARKGISISVSDVRKGGRERVSHTELFLRPRQEEQIPMVWNVEYGNWCHVTSPLRMMRFKRFKANVKWGGL